MVATRYDLPAPSKNLRSKDCHDSREAHARQPSSLPLRAAGGHHACREGIPFERRTIDLAAKPDWFLAISPLGKVPLLLIEREDGTQAVVFESAVICEYLEDTLPDVPLHPIDPLTRAQHRGWIEFGSSILSDLWGFETAKAAESFEAKGRALAMKFARVEAELGDGPYFTGERFSLVDATYAPIFRYFDVFDTITRTGLLDAFANVMRWRAALAVRPSVQQAVAPDYADRLRAFLQDHDAWLLKRRM